MGQVITPFSSFKQAARVVLGDLQRQFGFQCWFVCTMGHGLASILVLHGHYSTVQEGDQVTLEELLGLAGEQLDSPQVLTNYPEYLARSKKTALLSKMPGALLSIPMGNPDGSVFGLLCAVDARAQDESLPDHMPFWLSTARLLASLRLSGQQVQDQHHLALQARAAKEDVLRDAHRLQERIRELSCQYELDLLALEEGLSVPALLQRAVELIANTWSVGKPVQAQVLFEGETFGSSTTEECCWCQAEPLRLGAAEVGSLRVCYETDSPLDGNVFDEESQLLRSFALRLMAIVRRKRAEQALKKEHWRLQSTIEGTHVGTWEWNVQTGETVFNERWAEIIGYRLDELGPISIDTWVRFANSDDLGLSDQMLEEHFSGKREFYDLECRMRHKKGHWVWVHDRGKVFEWDEQGRPLVMYGTHQDITERKETEQALFEAQQRFERLSKHDGLTGLLNQRGWQEALLSEQGRSERYQHDVGVLVCDLDGLKQVNDSHGHKVGDEWIQLAADCIKNTARDGDLVARIGGDEFAVLALECSSKALDRLMARFQKALLEHSIASSWGGALCTVGSSLDDAVMLADRRMYQMKAEHHGRSCVEDRL